MTTHPDPRHSVAVFAVADPGECLRGWARAMSAHGPWRDVMYCSLASVNGAASHEIALGETKADDDRAAQALREADVIIFDASDDYGATDILQRFGVSSKGLRVVYHPGPDYVARPEYCDALDAHLNVQMRLFPTTSVAPRENSCSIPSYYLHPTIESKCSLESSHHGTRVAVANEPDLGGDQGALWQAVATAASRVGSSLLSLSAGRLREEWIADILVAGTSERAALSAGVLRAMANGAALLRLDSQFARTGFEVPERRCRNREELADVLCEYVRDPILLRESRSRTRAWAEENLAGVVIEGQLRRLLTPAIRRWAETSASTDASPRAIHVKRHLSVAMIAKNEEMGLLSAVRSVRRLEDVAEVVVVDTGSTDRTIEVARDAGAVVFEQPWRNDFAWHRNHVASLCANDWLFVIDGDEELVDLGNLGAALRSAREDEAVALRVDCIAAEDGQNEAAAASSRLLSLRAYNRQSCSWKYAIHNQLQGFKRTRVSTGRVLAFYDSVAAIATRERLQVQMHHWSGDPTAPHYLYHITQSHRALHEPHKVLEWATRYLDSPRRVGIQDATVLTWMAEALLAVGEVNAARELVQRSLLRFPRFPDLLHLSAAMAIEDWYSSHYSPSRAYAWQPISSRKPAQQIPRAARLLALPLIFEPELSAPGHTTSLAKARVARGVPEKGLHASYVAPAMAPHVVAYAKNALERAGGRWGNSRDAVKIATWFGAEPPIQVDASVVRWWVGSDVLELRAGRTTVHSNSAELNWTVTEALAQELRELGVSSSVVPIAPSWSPRVLPIPTEPVVLAYCPSGRDELYGWETVKLVASLCPNIEFRVLAREGSSGLPNIRLLGTVAREEMSAIYASCTLVYRPTVHDGLSLMVLEALGFGRHVVWSSQHAACHRAREPGSDAKLIRQLVQAQTNEAGLVVARRLRATASDALAAALERHQQVVAKSLGNKAR